MPVWKDKPFKETALSEGTLLIWNVAYLEHVWEEEHETRVHASTQAH